MAGEHEEELGRVQEQLRRERDRAAADREHFDREIDAVGRVIKVGETKFRLNAQSGEEAELQERTEAAVERLRENEEAKRRNLTKKHAAELAAIKEAEDAERSEWEAQFREENVCRQEI